METIGIARAAEGQMAHNPTRLRATEGQMAEKNQGSWATKGQIADEVPTSRADYRFK